MANVKITALTNLAAADVDVADVFIIDDVSVPESKKITVANLRAAVDTIATSNINTVSSNVDAVEARRVANVTIFTTEDTALQARLTTNVLAFTNEDTALQARITANNTLLHSNDFVTFTRLQANIDLVQDNVASVTVGTAADTETRLNANLDVTNDNASALTTTVDNFGTYANTNLDTKANVSATYFLALANDFATYSLLNANLDVIQDNVATLTTTVDNFGTSSNTNAAALAAGIASLSSVDTATGTETRLNANLDITNDNVSTLTTTVDNYGTYGNTNFDTKSNVSATYIQLNSNINVVQDNVAAITDGSTAFTGEVTMNDDLIVTGNLTVNGTTTTINTTNMDVDDTLIMLANGTTGSPTNDIGILFNRGDEGNAAFFYDESSVTFKISDTLDPKSNTSLSPVTSANLDVGILTASTLKYDGTDVGTSITDNVAAVETRRTANIAGAISTVLTSDLTASRALIAGTGGKIEVSDITSTELGYLDGMTQNINSNLAALAAGIAGVASSGAFPTGDYGLLDAANSSTDSFGVAVAGLTTFDMKTEPAGSLATEDLGALT